MLILLKAIYTLNVIPIKMPSHISYNKAYNSKTCLKISKTPQIAKIILRKKDQAGGITLADFRVYYKVTKIV